MHQPGLCVRNTVCAELPRSCPEGEGTIGPGNMSRGGGPGSWSLATAMAAAHFCFSPRGWDMGDSDRYLPAVLHGCVPVMSDRVEGMPLQEHPGLDLLLTTYYLLLTTYYLLLTKEHPGLDLLLTTYYLLRSTLASTYYLLLTTY